MHSYPGWKPQDCLSSCTTTKTYAPHQNLITLHNTLWIELHIFIDCSAFDRTVSWRKVPRIEKFQHPHTRKRFLNFVTGTDFCCNFNIYFPEESVPGRKQLHNKDNFLTREMYLHGRATFAYQTFPLLTFPRNTFPLFEAPDLEAPDPYPIS